MSPKGMLTKDKPFQKGIILDVNEVRKMLATRGTGATRIPKLVEQHKTKDTYYYINIKFSTSKKFVLLPVARLMYAFRNPDTFTPDMHVYFRNGNTADFSAENLTTNVAESTLQKFKMSAQELTDTYHLYKGKLGQIGKHFKTSRNVIYKLFVKANLQLPMYIENEAGILFNEDELKAALDYAGMKVFNTSRSIFMRGTSVGDDGYADICVKNKRRQVHRLILEYKLQRKLKKGEISHHIDGNPKNNKMSNLQVATPKQHNAIHIKGRGKKQKSIAS